MSVYSNSTVTRLDGRLYPPFPCLCHWSSFPQKCSFVYHFTTTTCMSSFLLGSLSIWSFHLKLSRGAENCEPNDKY
jgi:hypothetical protein